MSGNLSEGTEPKPVGQWFKSSYSTGNSHCVEAQRLATGHLAVRDSKNIGPFLTFPPEAWSAFAQSLKDGAALLAD
jgi:hypothetical protein